MTAGLNAATNLVLRADTAADLMTPNPISLRDDATRIMHLLEVVQQQEHLAGLEMLAQPVERQRVADVLDVERLRHEIRDRRRVHAKADMAVVG